MFKAKQLDKLVKAGIISPEQKGEILEFDDAASGGFVMKALSLLGIFTIGIGVISIIASNWEALSDGVKLFVMFALLFGTAGGVVYSKQKGLAERAEKLLLALFLLVGAAIGLVIQVYQLSGGNYHLPFAFWWLSTLPLLFVAKKKYVAWFWAPLFLVWCAMYADGDFGIETLLAVYGVCAVWGKLLCRYVPTFVAGAVLKKDAFVAFYLVFAIYILWSRGWSLFISAVILLISSAFYHFYKEYRLVRQNVKFAGLWVFSLYIYLGDKIGLFGTGIGLIISGVLLIALIKAVSRISQRLKGEVKNV